MLRHKITICIKLKSNFRQYNKKYKFPLDYHEKMCYNYIALENNAFIGVWRSW